MAVGLQSLLRTVVDNKASGLHIRGNSNAYVRLNGQMKPIEDSFVSNDEAKKMAFACMGERERKIFEQYNTVDFSLDAKSYGRFRFNVFRQMGKFCMAIRYIPYKIPSFESLHLPGEILRKMAENRRGLILVTGMTGSGKSSTLAAMIDHINQNRAGHILTIEDPVEFIHTDNRCIVSQLELGVDTPSYTRALRAAMRQDPDVVLIGELRDGEVMKAAISAAETGQLVLGTMHTVNVTQTLSRLVDAFPVEQHDQVRLQLSELIRGIVCQRLLPTINPGMCPALEILVSTPQVRKLIMENKPSDLFKAMQTGEFYGMNTFDQALAKLYKAGQIDMETAQSAATSPDAIMLAIRGVTDSLEMMEAE
ncbi:MAG: PilT/PilU family type 4a pilus ATPase [Elusimicrobiaceae bacterium]|nr:PilT/PilU family type 4a pilus ATPase [Elusimicrobiaceae bacterium]